MGTALIMIALVLIGIVAIRSYAKKLSSGCCGATVDKQKKVRVRDKDPAHYPYCVQIGIQGMTCGHCKERVENAINAEDGAWAEVHLKEHSAVVHMKRQLPEDMLRRIISSAGYTVTEITPVTP